MRRTRKDVLIRRPIVALVVTALLAVSVVFIGAGTLTASAPFTSESLTSHIPGMGYVHSVAWNGSYWLIGGEYDEKLVRYDGGSTYTNLVFNLPIDMHIVYSVAWNGSYWLIGGDGPLSILVKYDGTSFTNLGYPPTLNTVHSIAWNGSYWLIGDGGPGTLVRYDGTTYTSLTSSLPGMTTVFSIAWNGSYWLIGGVGTERLVKYDGTNFTDLTSSVSGMNNVNAVAWNGSYWLIGGGGTSSLVKYNGSAFTDLTSNVPGMSSVHSVAWNGSYWLIGGEGAERLVKYDGTTYTDLTSSIPNMSYVNSVAWGGGYWLVGGQSSETLYKLTVVTYTLTPSAGPHGTISPATPQTVDGGGSKTFNFTASSGYHIDDVLVDGASVGAVGSYTFNDVAGNHTIAVSFAADPVPPPVTDLSTWYLAEGTTAWGFSTYVTIQNPNSSETEAKVTYMPTGKANEVENLLLPPNSQTTLNPADIVGSVDFSTKVEAVDKTKPIAVDRTMIWTGQGAASPEGHSSVGVTSPSKTWYLAEGSSAWNFECWLLIQNPNARAANCRVTYMIENEGPKTVDHAVPANSRATFDMSKDIGNKDASIKVESDIPVIPERAMYRNNRREGHDSIGTTIPAADYYLAEGATGYNVGYITYVLVQNPNDSPTDVAITYLTGSGQVAGPSFQMPANSRKTIKVNDQLPANTDVSTKVHGSAPIIAERAMYWNNGTGEACHDSIGMDQPHMKFYLPDGQSSEGRETWTLVQNPNGNDVTVDVTYMTPNGQGNVVKTETIGANSRKTFNMAEHSGINGRAAIMVTSKTAGKKIMVERAMYWNNRGAGTDTIGGCGD